MKRSLPDRQLRELRELFPQMFRTGIPEEIVVIVAGSLSEFHSVSEGNKPARRAFLLSDILFLNLKCYPIHIVINGDKPAAIRNCQPVIIINLNILYFTHS